MPEVRQGPKSVSLSAQGPVASLCSRSSEDSIVGTSYLIFDRHTSPGRHGGELLALHCSVARKVATVAVW